MQEAPRHERHGMSIGAQASQAPSPFGRGTVLGLIGVGFLAFLTMLFFLATGATGERDGSRTAHAATDGVHGFSALSHLLRSNGIDVALSRSRSGLETTGLLVLTPTINADPERIGAVLADRSDKGPTLVIMPKWVAAPPPDDLPEEQAENIRKDWVRLASGRAATWAAELPAPFDFDHRMLPAMENSEMAWSGFGFEGELPTPAVLITPANPLHRPLVIDTAGNMLAFTVEGEPGTDYYDNAHWVAFVAEPDLVNNFGLADPVRAALSLALVREVIYGDETPVTFDLTLAGLGDGTNLLTLAFRPPFLAATLCLIIALLIVGWRAFLRFGPTSAPEQDIALGKARLVENGAGLIVRARRMRLLADPYSRMLRGRAAALVGVQRSDTAGLDEAVAARLPDSETFSTLAERLRQADTPADILSAARALDHMTRKLSQ